MAAVVARKGPTGVLPAASPFAELLRRSRFASFDPEIKQTYSAPPAFAHRGNWGLKRPISQRRRNAFITLKSYEEHAQYIEWNNAEDQVRFIKRFEELNVTPQIASNDPRAPTSVEQKSMLWNKNLGPVASSLWLTDSEFDTAKDREYRYAAYEQPPAAEEKAAEEEDVYEDISSLGKRGPGHYGARAQHATKASLAPLARSEPWNFRQPNILAMSPGEFESYIERLRTLRPIFYEKIRAQLQLKAKAGQLNGTLLNPDMDDFQLAIANVVSSDHRAFLNEYFESEYAQRDGDTELAAPDFETGEALPKEFVNTKIKPQPHRNGGLMYAHPSLLDTYFTTTPQSAFVLGAKESARMSSTTDVGFNVSFGGVVAHLERVPSHKEPLFTRTSGPTGAEVGQSVVGVRVSEYIVEQPPRVVGRHGQGLNGVTVREKVVLSPPHHERHPGNPERPGTKKYVSSRDDPMPINMRPRMFAKGNFWTTPNGQSQAVRTGKKGSPRVKDALSSLRRMAESVPGSEGSS
ncbi:hypothetical protein EST38_g3056 [Candolleomyces aberdarensis]|uniref:Uncharacterized protein n=1 Tax=Candolleomyces aberdarensis TaxID=2316362 RepID=A0A4Q2DRI0_9AGAR|nr:hypothetical protein EST38_g3056 [Candolleomyces aberdarensis]